MAAKANSPTSPKMLRGAARQAEALRLRIGGATYRAIGAELSMTGAGAYKSVTRALRAISRQTGETAEELRRLELERLDRLWESAFRLATVTHDIPAVRACLGIQERRARLLGLDAAQEFSLLDIESISRKVIQVVTAEAPADVRERIFAALEFSDGREPIGGAETP